MNQKLGHERYEDKRPCSTTFLNNEKVGQGRVVRKPVNANPELKVNRRNNYSPIKMLSTAFVLCSLRLLMLKTEGQKIYTEHLAEMRQNWNQNSR